MAFDFNKELSDSGNSSVKIADELSAIISYKHLIEKLQIVAIQTYGEVDFTESQIQLDPDKNLITIKDNYVYQYLCFINCYGNGIEDSVLQGFRYKVPVLSPVYPYAQAYTLPSYNDTNLDNTYRVSGFFVRYIIEHVHKDDDKCIFHLNLLFLNKFVDNIFSRLVVDDNNYPRCFSFMPYIHHIVKPIMYRDSTWNLANQKYNEEQMKSFLSFATNSNGYLCYLTNEPKELIKFCYKLAALDTKTDLFSAIMIFQTIYKAKTFNSKGHKWKSKFSKFKVKYDLKNKSYDFFRLVRQSISYKEITEFLESVCDISPDI